MGLEDTIPLDLVVYIFFSNNHGSVENCEIFERQLLLEIEECFIEP